MASGDNTKVELSAEDFLCAVNVAALQVLRKLSKDRNAGPRSNTKRSIRRIIADGAAGLMGEIALSRYLNKAWTPGGMVASKGDVGFKVEARTTDWEDGHLLVYDGDDDGAKIYLVVGQYPEFRIAGWIFGANAKSNEFWKNEADPPCWWVPQDKLGGRAS